MLFPLCRFNRLKEPSTSNEVLNESVPDKTTPAGVKPISEADILQAVPRTYKIQARGLLTWLTRNPQELSWDHKGEVTIGEVPLPGSSIADLVNDSLRSRKGFKPLAREAFTLAKTLAKINTPEGFVRNDEIRKQMNRLTSRNFRL